MDLYFAFSYSLLILFNMSSVAADCIVDDIAVQENFDLERFSGKWYEHRWYTTQKYDPSTIYLDYIDNYVITDTGNITNYNTWRYPDTKQCDEEHSVLVPSETPGKMTLVYMSGRMISYWVVGTDYTQYAMVYGCADVSPTTGTCDDVEIWIWGRSQQVPAVIVQKEQAFYELACVNASEVHTPQQTEECALGKVYKMNPNQTCTIDSFDVQDIDEDKFAGLWYEILWITQEELPESAVLQDFMYEFIKVVDGKFDIYQRGRGDKCIYNKNRFEATSTPKQYNYEGMVDVYSFKLPAWIIETDYSNYAVQLSCRNIEEGVCTRNELYVRSRGRSLAPQYMHRVNTVIQHLCLNPASGFVILEDNVCPPPWKDTFCEPIPGDGSSDPPRVSIVWTVVSLVLCLLYD